MTKPLKLILPLALVLALCGCAATQSVPAMPGAPGFWLGLWHGCIIFFTIIGSIFFRDLRIYAVPNSGFFYDLGFFVGCCIALGGSAHAGRRRR